MIEVLVEETFVPGATSMVVETPALADGDAIVILTVHDANSSSGSLPDLSETVITGGSLSVATDVRLYYRAAYVGATDVGATEFEITQTVAPTACAVWVLRGADVTNWSADTAFQNFTDKPSTDDPCDTDGDDPDTATVEIDAAGAFVVSAVFGQANGACADFALPAVEGPDYGATPSYTVIEADPTNDEWWFARHRVSGRTHDAADVGYTLSLGPPVAFVRAGLVLFAIESLGDEADLLATALDASSIELEWTDYTGGSADGFSIERSANGISGWTEIDTVDGATLDYTDSGLAAATTYWYRVRGFVLGPTYFDYTDVAFATTESAGGGGGGGGGSGTTPTLHGFTLPDPWAYLEEPGYRGASVEMPDGTLYFDNVQSDAKRAFTLRFRGLTDGQRATLENAFAVLKLGYSVDNFTAPTGREYTVTRDIRQHGLRWRLTPAAGDAAYWETDLVLREV